MVIWKKVLLGFISLLLVLSIFILGIFWSLHTFIYPQIYEKALGDSGAYNSFNLSEIQGGGNFIKIGSGGIQPVVNRLLENTLSYLRGDTSKLNWTLEVGRQKLKDLFVKDAEELRVCNSGESSFNGTEPVCRPRDVNASEYLDQVLDKKNFTLLEEGKVDLANFLGVNKTGLEGVRNYVMNYNEIFYGLIVLIVLLIGVIFFVSDSWTRWSGADLFLGGAGVFAISSIISQILLISIPSEVSFLQKTLNELFGIFTGRLQTYSYVFLGWGILFFVISFFIKKKGAE